MKDGKTTEFKHHHDTLVPLQTGAYKHDSHLYGKHAAGHTKHKEHVMKHFKGK